MSHDRSPDPSTTPLATSAYMLSDQNDYTTSDDEVASLPSVSTTESELAELDSDSEYSDAEAEWRESLEQLELLMTMMVVPVVGKYLGRRCAYWGWDRFMKWKYPIETVVDNNWGFFSRAGSARTKAPL